MELDMFIRGESLPRDIHQRIIANGTGGSLILPSRLVIMLLDDFKPEDADVFERVAKFRVSLGKSMMMVSLAFETFTFDLIWLSHIAVKYNEPLLPEPDPGEHSLYGFVLCDGLGIIRSIRHSTISPEATRAIWRAQSSLMRKRPDEKKAMSEVKSLFLKYPNGFQDGFFHEVCKLGD